MASERTPVTGDGLEQAAAQQCRQYHEGARALRDGGEARAMLSRLAAKFYERAKIPVDGSETFHLLEDPDSVALEVAHDAQLPHLGIVRMVLKALEVVRLERQGVTLYMIGTHYAAAMRPGNLRYGMPLMGRSPDALHDPPRIPVGPGSQRIPFCWLPPPSLTDLANLENRLMEYIGHNVGHERRAGHDISDAAKDLVVQRLREQFRLLASAAREVSNFGDWFVRVQHELLRDMLGSEVRRVIFLPMADLKELVRPHLEEIAQIAPSRFWLHCPSCRHRQRLSWTPGTSIPFACEGCGQSKRLSQTEAWDLTFPDVVAFEAALVRLGIDGWIVGSRAPYHPQVELLHRRLWGREMPPKFFITSVPRFRGVGDPPDGYGKTRLLRALLEVEPAKLARLLSEPWVKSPDIVSEFLA